MKTTLRIGEIRDAWTNCSTISPEVKLLLNPIVPVAQKVHPILQPTYPKSPQIHSKQKQLRFRKKNQTKKISNLLMNKKDLRRNAQGGPCAPVVGLAIVLPQAAIVPHDHRLHQRPILIETTIQTMWELNSSEESHRTGGVRELTWSLMRSLVVRWSEESVAEWTEEVRVLNLED